MPVDVLDREITIPEVSLDSAVRKNNNSNESPKYINHPPENESNNTIAANLEPQMPSDTMYYKSTKEILDYYCRTKNVEIGTERTQKLQSIVDKMTGQDGEHDVLLNTSRKPVKTRVGIINKGKEENAFALPDGTILVSQSLLNKLDSLDEVAGVLAHEVGHIRTETTVKIGNAGIGNKLGVCWIHEAAEDLMAPELLVKADLNSLGFASAIKKISGNERGVEHQSGLSRSAQSVGQHFGLDFGTSGREITPLEDVFKKDVPLTNIELTREIISQGDTKLLKEILPLLHPSDLYTISKETGGDKNQHLIDIITAFTVSQLQQQGFQDSDISTFLLINHNTCAMSFSFIQDSEAVITAFRELPTFKRNATFKTMQEVLYGKAFIEPTGAEAIETIATNADIPLTQEYAIEIMKQVETLDSRMYVDERKKLTTMLAERIIAEECYDGRNTWGMRGRVRVKTLNEEKLRSFLKTLHSEGIQINAPDTPKNSKTLYRVYMQEQKQIDTMYEEIYGSEATAEVNNEYIDNFVQRINEAHEASVKNVLLRDFFVQTRAWFNSNETPESERENVINYFASKVPTIELPNGLNLNEEYKVGLPEDMDTQEKNRKLFEYSLKTSAAIAFYQTDTEAFYTHISKFMQDSDIDMPALPTEGVYTMCKGMLSATAYEYPRLHIFSGYEAGLGEGLLIKQRDYSAESSVEIKDFASFFKLPFLKEAVKRSEIPLGYTNIHELKRHCDNDALKAKPFEDSLLSIVTKRAVRENFSQILEQEVPDSDYDVLFQFIERHYPNGPQKDAFLRELHHRIIDTPITDREDLTRKIYYLNANFDQIGPDGMVKVAEHITNLADYEYFREAMGHTLAGYLDGSQRVTQLAGTDNLSSLVANQFEHLLDSCKSDNKTKRKTSTRLADEWYKAFAGKIGIDKEKDKITINGDTRGIFRTFSDYVHELKDMSEFRRFAIAQKALVDTDGALTTDENRKVLAKSLVTSLGIEPGFVTQAVARMCQVAPEEFFSYPIAKMLVPNMFRAIDVDAVDMKSFIQKHTFSFQNDAQMLEKTVKETTRDITVFWPYYTKDLNTEASTLAQESDEQYTHTTNLLKQLLEREEPQAPGSGVKQTEIDSGMEAIIGGVEAGGPLGKRCLQLARQLEEFSPAVDRRLADSFDSAPGLNKLLFWENLVRDMESGSDPELSEFIRNRIVSIDEVIAGGSQNTVVSGKALDENNIEQDVVFIYLNPNPEIFIRTTHDTAQEVLEGIEKTGSRKDKKYAKMGQILVDLAQEWCLRDINDPTYEADDDTFRENITSFNEAHTEAPFSFSAPERVATFRKLRSETNAHAQTVNKFLNDDAVPPSEKHQVVQAITQFFDHQLSREAGIDELGNPYYLIHSDPHVGNYIVDSEDSGHQNISVIDRHMYLKISETEAAMFKNLLENGNYKDFIYPFIENLMDRNNIQDPDARNSRRNRLMRSLKTEYLKQRISSMGRGKFGADIDNFSLIRTLLNECSDQKMDIPLELRLMIRNVEAFRNLGRRYEEVPQAA